MDNHAADALGARKGHSDQGCQKRNSVHLDRDWAPTAKGAVILVCCRSVATRGKLCNFI
jgi:hypothetical protein